MLSRDRISLNRSHLCLTGFPLDWRELIFCERKLRFPSDRRWRVSTLTSSHVVYTRLSFTPVGLTLNSLLSRGRLGLWLDADLYHGTTSRCSTFNNPPLSSKQDFTVQNLEVWAFEWAATPETHTDTLYHVHCDALLPAQHDVRKDTPQLFDLGCRFLPHRTKYLLILDMVLLGSAWSEF